MFFIDFTLDYCDIYILFRILTWHATFALKTIEGSKQHRTPQHMRRRHIEIINIPKKSDETNF